ncbi:MAG: hypothetical protein IPH57_11860 [Saprospiraceae bacterium]|nr:hypothetical protein [Saprospiraceae bacterium]
MKSQFLYFIIFVISLSYGCGKVSFKDRKVAKVYGETLRNSEIDYRVWDNMDSNDSATMKSLFVEHWIRKQLLLHKAQISSEDKKTIDKLTNDYKNSLIIDFYENRIIDEQLDSIISDQELKDYYEQVKNNFKLDETVFNLKFIKLVADKQTINKIKNLWNSGKYKGITDYINLSQEESALNNDFWISSSKLSQIIPRSLIQDKSSYEVQKNINGTEYFLKVTNSRHKNEIIPLPIIKDEIRELILKKRKTDLLDSFIADLYKQETKNNNVKIYD